MSTQQTKSLIENRAKKLGYSSSEDFLAHCAPDFCILKTKVQHEQVPLTIKGVTIYDDIIINVDKDIHKLLDLLNCFEMTTYMSCQCDLFGYVNITFTLKGFQTIVEYIIKTLKAKENSKTDEDYQRLIQHELIQRFVVDTNTQQRRDNRITFISYIDSVTLKPIQTVRWQFLSTDLEKVTSQIKELVDFNIAFLESIKENF